MKYGSRASIGRRTTLAVLVLAGALLSDPAGAWSGDEHRLVARLATAMAPADLPDFFRGGGEVIADVSVEPDTLRLRAVPQLRSHKSPEHYIDLELLGGADLPALRYEYIDLLYRKKLRPGRVGLVPYAIVESTQHLAVLFAEHRLRPEDESIRARVLHRAGILSHYAADMSQPLHTTVHHNGRAREDGSSPGTGIHHRVDTLPGRAEAVFSAPPTTPWPRPFSDLVPGVLEALTASHALVDRVYELEDRLEWPEGSEPSQEVREFASERLTASVLLTARLFATAWTLSGDLQLPSWRVEQIQKQAE